MWRGCWTAWPKRRRRSGGDRRRPAADPPRRHNILENSLEYKDRGTGTVLVRLERNGRGCRLTFLDDGPGVPVEALPHLFEVFYRSDPARRNPEQGSGLGLAIVSNIVRRMGGAAEAFSGTPRGLSGQFALILLDLMPPGVDGFTLCRKLREKLDIPILMVTARQEDIDKIRGLGLGADDYIEKPFSPSVLVARVKANLAQYARRTARRKSRSARCA